MRELDNWGPPDESLVRLVAIHDALKKTPALDAENRRLFARQKMIQKELTKEELNAIKIFIRNRKY